VRKAEYLREIIMQTIGDLIELRRGNTYKSEFLGQPGPVLLGLASIQRNGGFRDDNLKTYGGQSNPKILLRPGDLYVSLKDVTQSAELLGAVAKVPDSVEFGRLTQDTVKLEPKRSDVPMNLIYWLLRTPQYREYCRAHSTGTTNLGLSREDFLAFGVPEYSSSLASFVHLLDGLETKIELNRRTNETLEAIARAVFRDWFVDFGPTRAKMEGRDPYLAPDLWSVFPDRLDEEGRPEGWRIISLGETVSVLRRGLSPKYANAGGICVLNQKCIKNRSVDLSRSRRHDHEARPVDERLLAPGDILVNSTGVGTLGRAAQIWELGEPMIVDSHVTVIRAAEKIISKLCLGMNLTGREEEIEFLGEGSTGQTELGRARLSELPILVPDMPIQELYDQHAMPLIEKMHANSEASRTLAALRDFLLPKLVSGEIRVRDAEVAVSDAV
jgi:type I restriction enzyme S subunit